MAALSGQVYLQKHMSWDIDKILVMVKFSIVNESHNILYIIYDV